MGGDEMKSPLPELAQGELCVEVRVFKQKNAQVSDFWGSYGFKLGNSLSSSQ